MHQDLLFGRKPFNLQGALALYRKTHQEQLQQFSVSHPAKAKLARSCQA